MADDYTFKNATGATVTKSAYDGGAGDLHEEVRIKDGFDVAQGTTTDAAVDTDTTGTLSGKLRGVVKLIVALTAKIPSLGAAAKAAAVPVTVATDQTTFPVGHDTTGLGDGTKIVSVAGTDEVLAGSTACKWCIVQAHTDNTGIIAVGVSGVDATVATGTGVHLAAGESVPVPCTNLNQIYVDASVSGESVCYLYGT